MQIEVVLGRRRDRRVGHPPININITRNKMGTDFIVFVIVEGMLALLFVVALVGDCCNWLKDKVAPATAEVIRGEKSMKAIHASFAIAASVFTLIPMACEALEYKVLLIVVNYLFLIYFFYSPWFRNKLFKLLHRARKG